ncbi:MAG: DUF3667 domain-containing protein [Saprospiraceae bacterium]
MENEKPTLERITLKKIFGDILDLFNIEKGLLYTVKVLTVQPGQAIKTYLFEDRKKMVKPFRYLILTTAIMAFLTINYIGVENSQFRKGIEMGFENRELEEQKQNPAKTARFEQMIKTIEVAYAKYFNLFIMFSIPIYAMCFAWFLKKPKLNYAEHLILASYLIAQQSVISILIKPVEKYNFELGTSLYTLIAIAYMFYLYQRFFGYKFIAGFFRVLAAYAIGTVIYTSVFGIGMAIYFFITIGVG